MICIKTGFTAYFANHEIIVRGDAFQLPSISMLNFDNREIHPQSCWLLLRVCEVTHLGGETSVIANITSERYDHWFDRDNLHARNNSTMLVAPDQWQWLSYEGMEIQL